MGTNQRSITINQSHSEIARRRLLSVLVYKFLGVGRFTLPRAARFLFIIVVGGLLFKLVFKLFVGLDDF
jgi:hypothetical protein